MTDTEEKFKSTRKRCQLSTEGYQWFTEMEYQHWLSSHYLREKFKRANDKLFEEREINE